MGHFCQLSQLICFGKRHLSYLHLYTGKVLGYLVYLISMRYFVFSKVFIFLMLNFCFCNLPLMFLITFGRCSVVLSMFPL